MLSSAIEVSLRGILGAVVVSLVLIVYQVADPPITTLGYCEERGRWLNVKDGIFRQHVDVSSGSCRPSVLLLSTERPRTVRHTRTFSCACLAYVCDIYPESTQLASCCAMQGVHIREPLVSKPWE